MRAAALAAALLLSLARCARCSGLGEAWRVAELARFAGGEAAAGARALYAAGAAALRHGDARQAAALLARAAEAGACCEPQYVLLTALRDECGGGARAAAARALAGALDTLNNNPTRGELGARAAAQARYGLAHHNRAEGELDAAWAHVLAGARDVYTADAQVRTMPLLPGCLVLYSSWVVAGANLRSVPIDSTHKNEGGGLDRSRVGAMQKMRTADQGPGSRSAPPSSCRARRRRCRRCRRPSRRRPCGAWASGWRRRGPRALRARGRGRCSSLDCQGGAGAQDRATPPRHGARGMVQHGQALRSVHVPLPPGCTHRRARCCVLTLATPIVARPS